MATTYNPTGLFASTAPYYARYRPGYPPEFFEHLVRRFALDGTQTVLDLGCGTGQIAIPLSQHVGTVFAVDPEPTMLEEGLVLATEVGASDIRWLQGDSTGLGALELPPLDLVTMGASFHWTDRDVLLSELDAMVTPGGAVVVASGGAPEDVTPPPWDEVIAEVRARYFGSERRAGSGTYSHPKDRHTDVLARSPFSEVESTSWNWTLGRDLDSVVGLQFSFSYSAPAQFASEPERLRFDEELRDVLVTAFPSGDFAESVRTEALIAVRP